MLRLLISFLVLHSERVIAFSDGTRYLGSNRYLQTPGARPHFRVWRQNAELPHFFSDGADELPTFERQFNICHMDASGEITECEILDESTLVERLGPRAAKRVLEDPAGSELFFGLPVAGESGADGTVLTKEGEALFTKEDWARCLNDETCVVPDDVLLRGWGPDLGREIALDQPATPADSARLALLDQIETTKQELATAEAAAAEASKRLDGLLAQVAELDDQRASSGRLHLHFGAGRLGMGLVVPAIAASGVPFTIIQRPKPRWMKAFGQASGNTDAKHIDVTVNSEVVARDVEVIGTALIAPKFLPPQSLIFGSSTNELSGILSKATSFSCSLGGAMSAVVLPLLSSLPYKPDNDDGSDGGRPLLFACENDHGAVMRLQKELAGKVDVIDCMVDRVCTGRTIQPSGVDVQAEPWRGSIVILAPNISSRVPFCASVATVPSSDREAAYYSDRKLSLVNGMHTGEALGMLRRLGCCCFFWVGLA